MKKQYLLAVAGVIAVVLLYSFGRTTETRKPSFSGKSKQTIADFNIETFVNAARQSLTPAQLLYVASLETNIKRGDVHTQQINAYTSLADFWKDSAHLFEAYAFYTGKAAKLDNSEKNLTFAARLFLNQLRGEHDDARLKWETEEAISLFESALAVNPENDELKIGLGSCYVFGKGRNGDPQETMKGIQLLLSVVRKDSSNMRAQLVLGAGGVISGQFDKAVERLQKVINHEPANVEAVAFLADAYAGKGEKAEAIKWYNVSKRLIDNPAYSKEVDERIKAMGQ